VKLWELMGRGYTADRSDRAKESVKIGTDVWKYNRDHNYYLNYSPQTVFGIVWIARRLIDVSPKEGPSQLLKEPPAKRFTESKSQNQR
jgi:hypothetical protein